MSQIDTPGTYRGEIMESAVGETKNGYPQLVVRLFATERYIESSSEMEHFGLDEPDWVDWRAYDETMMGFLVLATTEKRLFHFDGVMSALGWDGSSFAELDSTDHTKTEVMFRVEENEYNGEVRMQVAAIDHKDAPVSRELKKLDEGKLSDLDSKFKGIMESGKKKAAPKAAKAKAKSTGDSKATSKKPPKKTAPPKATTKAEGGELSDDDIPFDVAEVPSEPYDAQVYVWSALAEDVGDAGLDGLTEAWVTKVSEYGDDSEMVAADWIKVGKDVASSLRAEA